MLARPDRRGQMRPLAANLTRLVIVSSVRPAPEPLLVDQFCVVAERQGIEAIVVLNKSDLATDEQLVEFEKLLKVYADVGYQTALVNTKTPNSLDALTALLKNQTSVLVGQSGVGKSSIAQCLLPDMEIRTGAISQATGVGAHTTTVSFRYELSEGGVMIDSPGVRQFQVDYLTPTQISQGYREITEAAAGCRFSDCKHTVEPDCSVKQAVQTGAISEMRHSNYMKLAARNPD